MLARDQAPVVRRLTCLVLALALCLSVALKVETLLFRQTPGWHVLLPAVYWMRVASALELLLATLALSRAWRRSAVGVLALTPLLVIWLIVITRAGVEPTECGCFGRLRVPLAPHLVYILGLDVLALSALYGARGSFVERMRH